MHSAKPVLYGAFEDMRDSGASDGIAQDRLKTIFYSIGSGDRCGNTNELAGILLLFAFIVATMLLVAMTDCVVERLGQGKSMRAESS